jgi:hypothetical protein
VIAVQIKMVMLLLLLLLLVLVGEKHGLNRCSTASSMI